MKRKNFSTLSLSIMAFVILLASSACNKNDEKLTSNTPLSEVKLDSPISFPPIITIIIEIVIEPIRLARATTDRPRDGFNCGCNECFGVCNAPLNLAPHRLGIGPIDDDQITMYFLDSLPNNFETEFGVDEVVNLTTNNGHEYSIKPGIYTAVQESGQAGCIVDSIVYNYFGKVTLELN
jgi:hypothetical protein